MSEERAEESLAIGFCHAAMHFRGVTNMGIARDIPN